MSRILLKKEGTAKYISHLDLVRTMQRVFIRSGLIIKHTEGFNPHPYMSFALPLPVGTESDCELMDFVLLGGAELSDVPGIITANSPSGITVLDAYNETRKLKEIKWLQVDIRLTYDNGVPSECVEKLEKLFGADSLVIEKKTKNGTAAEDIIPLIRDISFSESSNTEVIIIASIAAQNPSLSPAQLVSAIDQHLNDLTPDFTSFRRLEIFDTDNNIFR